MTIAESPGPRRQRLRAAAGPLVAALLLGLGAVVIHRELRHYSLRDIQASLAELTLEQLTVALLLTALSYLVLTGYDYLGLRYAGKKLPYYKVATASFVGYVFSYNIGLSIFGGTATRYRLYSSWGLSALEIAKVVAFCALTFWLGVCATAGLALVIDPLPPHATLRFTPGSARALGVTLLLVAAAYLALTRLRKSPLSIRGVQLPLPSTRIALGQIALSLLDWLVAGAVLYVLLRGTISMSYPRFVGIFVLAQISGVASHVPGGLGVFETVMLFFLSPVAPAPAVLASIAAYRLIYYLIPLLLATSILGVNELVLRRQRVTALLENVSWVARVVPSVFGLTVFAAGVMLLLSGATPGVNSRLRWLYHVVPLGVVEVSHFLGSLIGASLLILARGLQRRIDAAFYATVALLAGGVMASLLKGLDFEEAAVLGLVLLALLPAREQFYRPASLLSSRFSLRWTVAVATALAAALWLFELSHRHTELSTLRFWEIAYRAETPRALRATTGAAVFALLVVAFRFLRPSTPRLTPADASELERALAVVKASPVAASSLALLGDKRFLFNDASTAFVMYAVEDRSWVSMGDPVGPSQEHRELAWRFRELADRYGGWPVFYEVGTKNLPLYLELGLTVLKLGEEGRVDLPEFSLAGGARKDLRFSLHRHRKLGSEFRIVPPAEVPPLLPRLRQISEEWLDSKHTREKGFSLGFFEESYLKHFPIACVSIKGEIVAFANVWASAGKAELTVDLMRHAREIPPGTMDYLFVELLLWGQREGFRWFGLGMAPLSGLEAHELAPLWTRVSSLVFHHGEHFYNFQGLRAYKEKFGPRWQPRYLACPGGLALPTVLTNVVALVSGGLTGMFKR